MSKQAKNFTTKKKDTQEFVTFNIRKYDCKDIEKEVINKYETTQRSLILIYFQWMKQEFCEKYKMVDKYK